MSALAIELGAPSDGTEVSGRGFLLTKDGSWKR